MSAQRLPRMQLFQGGRLGFERTADAREMAGVKAYVWLAEYDAAIAVVRRA